MAKHYASEEEAHETPAPKLAKPDGADPARRECLPDEVLCGICGYPAKVEKGPDGTEKLAPHFGKHD